MLFFKTLNNSQRYVKKRVGCLNPYRHHVQEHSTKNSPTIGRFIRRRVFHN